MVLQLLRFLKSRELLKKKKNDVKSAMRQKYRFSFKYFSGYLFIYNQDIPCVYLDINGLSPSNFFPEEEYNAVHLGKDHLSS